MSQTINPLFKKSKIPDAGVLPLKKHSDRRGYLIELFRDDAIGKWWASLPPEYRKGEQPKAVMAYFSLSYPGVERGPHEHVHQWDIFSFIGPGDFEVRLWDNRPDSPTYNNMMVFVAGENNPATVLVPPGVVHGYKLLSPYPGAVFNAPTKLFMGVDYKESVDEVRHEEDLSSPFNFRELPKAA